jgi:hypothetical protein
MQATATFDATGVRGKLVTANLTAPSDALFAGDSLYRMSVQLTPDGGFGFGPSNLLAPGQYVQADYVTDAIRARAALLESVFSVNDRVESFPSVPSILFWATPQETALRIENDDVRREQMMLVVQPIQWAPPEAGSTVLIPASLLPYRSITTAKGGYSSVYNNARREWLPQETAGETLLQFQIPAVCLPFDPESADVELLIRAASRIVTVLAGDRDELQQVAEWTSPLGTQSISIPAALIRTNCLNGELFLQINVSDLDSSMQSESMSGEQDDNWQIERVLLTLKGRREPGADASQSPSILPDTPPAASPTPGNASAAQEVAR